MIDIPNPDKTYYPRDGYTKRDVAEHYDRVADRMLRYIAGRPLMLKRVPGGIDKQAFYQKNTPDYYPDFVHRITVEHSEGPKEYASAENADALIYLAGQGAVELHMWLSTKDNLRRPDQMTFDLDPPGDDFATVQQGARTLKAFLERLGAHPIVKATGSSGLHVIVPLKGEEDFDEVRAFARAIGEAMSRNEPGTYTVEQRKEKRRGRLLIDYWRNAYAQTQVAPYSLRARPGAPVAAPVRWEEALDPSFRSDAISLEDMKDRPGDPWEGAWEHATTVAAMQDSLHKP